MHAFAAAAALPLLFATAGPASLAPAAAAPAKAPALGSWRQISIPGQETCGSAYQYYERYTYGRQVRVGWHTYASEGGGKPVPVTQVVAWAMKYGLKTTQQITEFSTIPLMESGYCPKAYNRNDAGLFQINGPHHPSMITKRWNPEQATAYAVRLYLKQGTAPWKGAGVKKYPTDWQRWIVQTRRQAETVPAYLKIAKAELAAAKKPR